MDPVICIERDSGYIERKCNRRIGNRGVRIRDSRRFFNESKEGIWWRRREIGEGSRIEEAGTRREDDGRICAGVQMSGKRKWV